MVDEKACSKNAFEYKFPEGYSAVCMNTNSFSSNVFKSVYDESKHDIMMPFAYNGRFWVCSLYTFKDNIDCSAIAKARGGGGHLKAAGFQADKFENIFK